MNDSISLRTAALINASSKYFIIFCNLAFSAILARILSPRDYGIVAVTTVFTVFFSLFADMGIGAGIIQNKDIKKEEIAGIFGFSLLLAVILGFIFILFSFILVWFYHNAIYKSIGYLLAVSLFFSTLNIVPNAILMKDKQFISVAIRNIIVSIATSMLAILFALLGMRYYALILQSLLSSLLMFLWNLITTYRKYGLIFHYKYAVNGLKEIMSFSGFQFGFNLINYFARNLDNLLTSKVMGEIALGYYDKAYKLMLYPVQNLTGVISSVLHPILSDHQQDKRYIYLKYLDIFKILSLAGVFISIFAYFASNEIVLIMFGHQWSKSVPCFKAMSVSVWFQITASSCGSIYQSIGNTKLMFRSCMTFVPIQVVMILIGVFSGNLVTLSWLVSISFIIKFIIEYYFLIKKGFNKSLLQFYDHIIPELKISFILIVFLYLESFVSTEGLFFSGFIKFMVSLIAFLLGLRITNQGKYIKNLLPGKIKKYLTATFGFLAEKI